MAAATPHPLQLQQLCLRGNAAAGRELHPRRLGRELAVEGQIGALHGAVAGNIRVDDGFAARCRQPLAEIHALFGADLFPAVDGNKAIFCVHAHRDLIAVLLQHPGRELKIRHGHAAQDAAPHAEGEIFFDPLLGADAPPTSMYRPPCFARAAMVS